MPKHLLRSVAVFSPPGEGGGGQVHGETIIELEPLLSTSDVSRISGRSVSTLEKDRLFGTGPAFVKIGRLVKYHPRDVREWLRSFQTVRSTLEAGEGR
jgi:hypothetical protein